jgi:hypothetical protein
LGAIRHLLSGDIDHKWGSRVNRGEGRRKIFSVICVVALRTLLCLATFSSIAWASAATFVTALPVAKDQWLIRFNAQQTFGTSSFASSQFPVNNAYGLTPRLALFLNFNQGFTSLTQGSAHLSSGGSGDTLAFARYTLFHIDKPKSTFRVAPLAGLSMPTGSNSLQGPQGLLPGSLQTGSGSFDPYYGVTMGYNNPHWGMAFDTTDRHNWVTGQGIRPGDQFRADAQFQLEFYLPKGLPEEGLPKGMDLSFESNYVQDGRRRINGVLAESSGGKTWKQDIFLELFTLHWQVGAGAQFPIMQDLNGSGQIKQRIGFSLFFEYYLAAPDWRHRKGHQ